MPYKYKKVGDKYVVYKKSGKRVGATDGDKESLRKYLAALHINAKENTMKKNRLKEAEGEFDKQDFKQLAKMDYPSFVAKLGEFAKDSKFQDFLKSGDAQASSVSEGGISVKNLIPTQNEIDVDKSLKFPLTQAAAAQYALKGGTVEVAKPIIVFNGKYIIDGHHRWSQLYAINQDAKIKVVNFTNPKVTSPKGALKATQLAIATLTTNIPASTVSGKNLLKMAAADVVKYVIDTIKDDVLYAFEESGKVPGKVGKKTDNSDYKKLVGQYIWSNVKSMQATSQPISGAPGRGVMPQADDVPGGQEKTIDALKQGVNIPVPLKEKEMKKINALRELLRREIKRAIREDESKPDYLDVDKDGNKEEPMKKALSDKEKSVQKEGVLDALKNLLQKKKQEAPKSTSTGKKIVGMDFDGYYIDEDGNRV